jgi:hypothetical protein
MVADGTTNNGQILMNECRNGSWYTYCDATSSISPTQGGPFAMTAGGSPGYSWDAEMSGMVGPSTSTNGYLGYAGMGFNFLTVSGTPYNIDPSITGFSFYAKLGSSSVMTNINVAITDAVQLAANAGPYGQNEALTTSWTQYTVSFSTNWANLYAGPTVFTPSQAEAMQFQCVAPGGTATTAQAFDVCVDDITFH